MHTITDKLLLFYGGGTPFSNWTQCEFVDPITCLKFYNSEQAFMWHKAHFFRDFDIAGIIASESDPKKVKEIGRQVRKFNYQAWDFVRYGIMSYVNFLKFSQNENIKKALLATGDLELVEASPYDKVWGIGFGMSDPESKDKSKWLGQNLLGKALVEVRSKLK